MSNILDSLYMFIIKIINYLIIIDCFCYWVIYWFAFVNMTDTPHNFKYKTKILFQEQ